MGDGWREEMRVCAQHQIASSLTRSAPLSLHSFLPSADGEANIYILHIMRLLPGLHIRSCSILMENTFQCSCPITGCFQSLMF